MGVGLGRNLKMVFLLEIHFSHFNGLIWASEGCLGGCRFRWKFEDEAPFHNWRRLSFCAVTVALCNVVS